MKRLFYLLIIIGAIIVVILLGYFLRYRAEEPAPATIETGGSGTLPKAEPGTPGSATDRSASGGKQTGEAEQQTGKPQIQPGEQQFGVIAQNPVAEYFVDEENGVVIVQPNGKIIKVLMKKEGILTSPVALLSENSNSFAKEKSAPTLFFMWLATTS